MKYITQIARTFVGILFIISGLIKLNDPMGFSFKLEEYFSVDVLNIPFLEPLVLPLALVIVIVEVLLGVALLIGFKPKITISLLALMIVFFTFLTFYSAYFNKVTDCGCFGDAIPLTPWESFGKDVILSVLILVIIAGRQYIKPLFNPKVNFAISLASLILCSFFGNHVLSHLPVKDFRAYAIGKSIVDGMKPAEEVGETPPEYQILYTLKNESTGELQKVDDQAYIDDKWWEDKNWKIQSDLTENVLLKEGYEPPIHDFSITNDNGDYTEEILGADAYLLVISYELESANEKGFEKMAKLGWEAEKANIPMMATTSITGQKVEDFKHQIQAPFAFALTDKTTLKTIVRSNPGLVYIKKGVVKGKWHYNDVPTIEQIEAL